MGPVGDPYAILGVHPDATDEAIDEAYRQQLGQLRPDHYPGDDGVRRQAQRLAEAKAILLDPRQRSALDEHRRNQSAPGSDAGIEVGLTGDVPSPVGAASWLPETPADGSASSATATDLRSQNGVAPATDPETPARTGKVVLTPDQARDGCAVAWVQETDDGPAVRTLHIPTDRSDGDLLEFSVDEVLGVRFPALLLQVVVEEPLLPTPWSEEPVMPGRERKPRRPHLYKIVGCTVAATAMALGAVFLLGVRDGSGPGGDAVAGGLSPAAALHTELASSKAAIRAMTPGEWVPVIGSLCTGLEKADLVDARERVGFPDGKTETYSGLAAADILGFHRALDARYPAVVSKEPPAAGCQSSSRWVMMVDAPQANAKKVEQWCQEEQLPRTSCKPRRISPALVASARYVPHLAHGVAVDVPWQLTPGADQAVLTDTQTGATLAISATPSDSAPKSRAAVEGQLSGPASKPTLSRDDADGFTVSGLTGSGEIYYWRQHQVADGVIDMLWTYPAEARGTYDAAVGRAANTLRPLA